MSAGSDPVADVLIVGSGAAGLTAALRLPEELSVTVLSKAGAEAGSTARAQGGIAAVLSAGDSFDDHIRDTMIAGAGLCRRPTVEKVVEEGPGLIGWLIDSGLQFTVDEAAGDLPWHLTREGGHSQRRIIHVDDATGRALSAHLLAMARKRPNITLCEDAIAIDLITGRHVGGENRCHGAYVYDRQSRAITARPARAVILATGGASKVYLYSSNPDVSTGDGIAMAWRAGCRVANMEFNQFHPTCLFHPGAGSFLLSEALRGEGAVLRLADGTRFMPDYDSRAELAPRDIVARAIDDRMKRLGLDCLWLDISHRPSDFIESHFPMLARRCREFGFDLTAGPVPVVPAAHYTCGGVIVDSHGKSDLPGLYVVGESSSTGLHGANRMASNSLLECLVYGAAAAADIARNLKDFAPPPALPAWDESRVTDSDEEVVVSHNWLELRRFMWNYVGIVRTTKRLERARRRIDLLRAEIADYYGNFRLTPDLVELRNLVTVADLIVRAAASRHESRGLHYTLDYPSTDAAFDGVDTVLIPG